MDSFYGHVKGVRLATSSTANWKIESMWFPKRRVELDVIIFFVLESVECELAFMQQVSGMEQQEVNFKGSPLDL